ncbi:MAG: alpha/beta fold hydrolase [Nanoarchaeota archaeon]|nr:alpha/beta fold hydrolase [Nanoarchaeota archaeon]
MGRVVYIIPGFGQKTALPEYQNVIKLFKAHQFQTIPVKISWKHKVMRDYVEQFLSQLQHHKSDEVALFGFSFGAMIALIAAVKIKPKMLFLCSLSPYFKEDLRTLKKSWKDYFGKRRMKDFQRFSFKALAKEIRCKTVLIIGEKEGEALLRRVKDARKRIKNAKLISVKGAKHNFAQKEYHRKLQELILGC